MFLSAHHICSLLTKYFKIRVTVSTTLPTLGGCLTNTQPTKILFFYDTATILHFNDSTKFLDFQQGLTDFLSGTIAYKICFQIPLPSAEATKAARRILHRVSQPSPPPPFPCQFTTLHNSANLCIFSTHQLKFIMHKLAWMLHLCQHRFTDVSINS